MVGQPPLKRPTAGSIPAWGTVFAPGATAFASPRGA
jgi:hypothetical protein